MSITMVFGWGKKQAKAQHADVPVRRKIALKDIDSALEDLVEQRRTTLVAEYRESLPQVRQRLEEMLQIAHTLENETLTESETDRHISAIVETGKNQVISTIKKTAGGNALVVAEYDDIASVNREMHRILKMIGDVLGRQTRVIHIFAKKHATQLKRTLSELDDTRDELTKSLKEHESFENTTAQLSAKVARLNSMHATIDQSSAKITDMKKQIDSHNDVSASSSAKIAEILASSEHAAYKKVLESIEDLDGQKRQLTRRIDDSFARISRPLSKYVYVSSLDKAAKATMQTMLQSPAGALFGTGSARIVMILEHVRKAIASNSISVKDSAKSQEQVDAVISDIDGFYAQIAEHVEKMDSQKSSLKEFDHSLLDAQNATLENSKEKIALLESRMREIDAECDSAKAAVPATLQDIEARLRAVTNIVYTISEET